MTFPSQAQEPFGTGVPFNTSKPYIQRGFAFDGLFGSSTAAAPTNGQTEPLNTDTDKAVNDYLQQHMDSEKLEEFKRRPGFLPMHLKSLETNYKAALDKIVSLEKAAKAAKAKMESMEREAKIRTNIMAGQADLIKVLEEKTMKK